MHHTRDMIYSTSVITGDVKFDHLVEVVFARFPTIVSHQVTMFPFPNSTQRRG